MPQQGNGRPGRFRQSTGGSFYRSSRAGGVNRNRYAPIYQRGVDVPVQIIVIGQAVEADTANTLTWRRALTIAQALETDTAQAVTHARAKTIGQPAEGDIAQALTHSRSKLIGQAVETDSALPLLHKRAAALAQPVDFETAFPLTAARRKSIGQATEADAALPLIHARAKPISQALETDTAGALTPLTTRKVLIGQAVENGSALALVIPLPAPPALHNPPLIWVDPKKTRPPAPIIVSIGQATETDSAPAVYFVRSTPAPPRALRLEPLDVLATPTVEVDHGQVLYDEVVELLMLGVI